MKPPVFLTEDVPEGKIETLAPRPTCREASGWGYLAKNCSPLDLPQGPGGVILWGQRMFAQPTATRAGYGKPIVATVSRQLVRTLFGQELPCPLQSYIL